MGCGSEGGKVLAATIVGITGVVTFTAVIVYCSILLLENVFKCNCRVTSQEESQGLDHSIHCGRAYTELQTTIFSYTTKSGEKAQMEMRVRAGDAAKFALSLSEVMDADVSGGSGKFSALAGLREGGDARAEMGGGDIVGGFGSLLGNPVQTIQERE